MRILGAVLVAAASASAQTTYTWQGGSGAWTQATQWSPQGVPGSAAGDAVVVPSGRVQLGAAPAHALASLAVTTGGEVVLEGGGWTLPISGAVVVGAGADAGTLTFDDDESPEGFITLACAELSVERGGFVNAVGTGYPGAPAGSGLPGSGPGAGGGAMGAAAFNAGGAGHAGAGCWGNGAGGTWYGDLFRPADPGSGGGATLSSGAGGNGGGRVRVVASQRIDVQGRVSADGQAGPLSAGSGSGGSLWLTAPQLSGSGQISASGADASCSSAGRILIDGLASTAFATTLRALGGHTCCLTGGAGTVVLATAGGERTLILDNLPWPPAAPTVLPALLVTHLKVSNYVTLWMPTEAELRVSGDALISASATLQLFGPGATGGGALLLRAGRLQVDGQIVASGLGWPGEYRVAGGPGHAIAPADGGTVAGSHGGAGAFAAPGSTYGAAASPVELGSGGTASVRIGAGFRGANGGGHVRLFAGTEASINGPVLAAGAAPDPLCPECSGGAGGSIWIAAPVVSGTGRLDATGASGGGGGRIAVFADQFAFAGPLAVGTTPGISGTGAPGTALSPAGDGLISLDDPPEGFSAEGRLSFSGFTLPTGAQFVVFVDDDTHLGDGSDGPNNADLSEPMRRQEAAASPVRVEGLTAGRRYFWNVVALGADGGVLAGAALSSFVACAGAGCGGPPELDAGLTLPDGGVVDRGPPRFASSPEDSAACGMPYAYSRDGRPQVVGAGPLRFSVEPPDGASLPAGVGVDADTGEILWTPSSQQEGVQRFDLVVTGPGGTARQPLDVIVVCRAEAEPMVHCGCAQGGFLWALVAVLLLESRKRRPARFGKTAG